MHNWEIQKYFDFMSNKQKLRFELSFRGKIMNKNNN